MSGCLRIRARGFAYSLVMSAPNGFILCYLDGKLQFSTISIDRVAEYS